MSNRTELSLRAFSSAALIVVLFSSLSYAATADRISGTLSAGQTVALQGNVHRQARPEFDRGPADPALRFGSIMLLTVPTASQQKDLNRLLAEQQDRKSPNYHKWLTPEQWADRFGLSRNDVNKLTAWLRGQGFSGIHVARGRNWIRFSGTASQVQSAFGTEIHRFNVNGEMHVSNATSPKIPRALAGVVTGVRGLNDFSLKPMSHPRARPYYDGSGAGYAELIAPGDIATMYDINALFTAGIDGTGQTLAVIGQTDIFLSDLLDFRTGFGLSPITSTNCTTTNDLITACSDPFFQYVLVGTDPGVPTGNFDLAEADLDVEWAGATARNAQIIYVNAPLINSGSTSSGGVDVALMDAIDNNRAAVISLSYGNCELFWPSTGTVIGSMDETELQKANTLGITVVSSSGDSGAAECDNQFPPVAGNLAQHGIAVTYPASSPEVTAVGGTSIDFANLPNPAAAPYWGTFPNPPPPDGGSMLTPIPEIAWNDDAELGAFCAANPTTNFCVNNHITDAQSAQASGLIGLEAGGGGVSNCATFDVNNVCQSGFPQPTWQSTLSIGQAAARYVPDVSLLASPNFPGYIYCTQQTALGLTGTGSACAPGTATGITNALALSNSPIIGGTSVGTPVFAGMVALLNQFLAGPATPGLGNINPMLYSLAAAPANNYFRHVNTGTNNLFCTAGTPTTQPAAYQCPAGGILGFDSANFDATTGYNLVTGLGSVDLNNLASAWGSTGAATTLALTASAPTANVGDSVTFTATLSPTTGTGEVVFLNNGSSIGAGLLTSGVATLATTALPTGSNSVTATYLGDGSNAKSTSAAVTVTVSAATFTLTPPSSVVTVTQGSAVDVSVTFGGFSAPVTFTCTEPATLTESVCTPPAAAQAAGKVSFHITTTAASLASNLDSARGARIFYAVLLPGLLGIMFTVGSRKRSMRGMRMLGLIVVLGVSTMWLGSCGGSSNSSQKNPGTPKGNYTVTVGGKSGAVTVTNTFTLTVQ
jgi:subtilase family serine protease